MNANDITYGIEIESLVSNETIARERLNIGRYHNGNQVPYLPQGWVAKSDSSIRAEDGYAGCEIVSPILKGEDGIRQVIEVVKTLKEKGHQVNESVGVHIHVGYNPEWGSDKLARLITIASYLEKGIFATTGTKKRERGTYCNAIRKYGNNQEAKNIMDSRRYHFLNITNLANHSKDTVEFRAFSGSLNEVKIVGCPVKQYGTVHRYRREGTRHQAASEMESETAEVLLGKRRQRTDRVGTASVLHRLANRLCKKPR